MFINRVYIGFTQGTSIFAKLIRRIDRPAWHDDPKGAARRKPVINHVYFRFVWSSGGPDLIYESLEPGGIGISPTSRLDEAIRKGKVKRKFERDLEVSAEHANILFERCCKVDGNGYDRRLIFLYLMWVRYFGRRPKWKALGMNHPDKYTCNEFIVKMSRGVVPRLEDLDLGYTPERLFRHVFGMPSDQWLLTHS